MSGIKGMKDYPPKVKLEAVRLFLEEGKTQTEIMEILGVRHQTQIQSWLRKYREYGSSVLETRKRTSLTSKLGRPRKRAESSEQLIARLEMENALLKKLQAELRKMSLAKRDIGRSTTTEKTTR